MTKMMLPLMMTKGGSIVNTSSFSGQAADLYRSGYNAAKGAVINFPPYWYIFGSIAPHD